MKKTITILLAVVMIVGLLAGCGGGGTNPTDPPKTGNPYDEVLTELKLPLVPEGEEVTLTIGVPDNIAIPDYETNKYTLWLEEQTGINLEFVRFTDGAGSADYLQKLSLMKVGGQKLPDIIWGINSNDDTTIKDLGEEGVFADLTYLIESYAPTYKAKLAEADASLQELVAKSGVAPDGGFYGMPKTGTKGYDSAYSFMWINEKWLKKVGKEIPTTLDELYDVLEAFKTQDPNGNGIQDEIPMAGLHHNLTTYIASAFLYHNPYRWLNAEDGEIYASVTSDEYRQALIVLNDMYNKGYITSESAYVESYADWKAFIQPSAHAEDLVNVVGIFTSNPVLSTNKGDLRFLEYVAMTELDAETDKGGWYVYNQPGVQWTTFITTDCPDEKKPLAMQLIDFMYSDEAVARSRHGEYGVDWQLVEGKSFETAETGERIIDTSIGDGKAFTEGNRTWNRTGSNIGTNKNQTAAPVATDNVWQAHSDKVTAPLREYIFEVDTPEEVISSLFYNEEEQEVYDECWTLLDECYRSNRAKFMVGILNPNNDADWNKYLTEMENLGLSRLLEEACQPAYDRMNGK